MVADDKRNGVQVTSKSGCCSNRLSLLDLLKRDLSSVAWNASRNPVRSEEIVWRWRTLTCQVVVKSFVVKSFVVKSFVVKSFVVKSLDVHHLHPFQNRFILHSNETIRAVWTPTLMQSSRILGADSGKPGTALRFQAREATDGHRYSNYRVAQFEDFKVWASNRVKTERNRRRLSCAESEEWPQVTLTW